MDKAKMTESQERDMGAKFRVTHSQGSARMESLASPST